MKASFEFKVNATNATDAQDQAAKLIADFLESTVGVAVLDRVDVEYKVSLPEDDKGGPFVVTVFGRVKPNSIFH